MAISSGLIRLRYSAAAIALLSMLVPISARANSSSSSLNSPSLTCVQGVGVCVQNQGGMASGSTAGFTMTGLNSSTVTQVGSLQGANLGTLSLTTGALLTGTLAGTGAGATFAPGTLTIDVNNYNGFSGVLFTGTFGSALSPITWQFKQKVNGEYLYLLSGPITGTWENSLQVSGVTTQIYFESKTPFKGGSISLADGSTLIVTPEPGTLTLMGTGLLGLAGLVKRRVGRDKRTA